MISQQVTTINLAGFIQWEVQFALVCGKTTPSLYEELDASLTYRNSSEYDQVQLNLAQHRLRSALAPEARLT